MMITEDFAGYAARLRVAFPVQLTAEEAQRRLESFMSGLASDCLERGTRLIGHIKCLVEGGEEIITCSVTDHDARVRCRGRFTAPRSEIGLIVNVMQYGLRKGDLMRVFADRAKSSFPDNIDMTIEDLEIERKDLIRLG